MPELLIKQAFIEAIVKYIYYMLKSKLMLSKKK